MQHDPIPTAEPDRRHPVDADQRELAAFAGRHGISTEEAREVIRRAGDRLTPDALAERLPK